MEQGARSGDMVDFPVDDATYNLLQALTSKLEAIDAYRAYVDDDGSRDSEIFQRLAETDYRHAEELLEALRRRLAD